MHLEAENELRIETASSILDDISTLAGSVIYAGESDTSTVQGEVPVSINNIDDDIKVDEALQEFDDAIQYHNNANEDRKSMRSISTSYISHKTSREEQADGNILKDAQNISLNKDDQMKASDSEVINSWY